MKLTQMHRRLSVQLGALMTIALLPLGSIAVFQTRQVAAETERSTELAIIGLTERAAKDEELLIERAVGMAQFFGKIAPDFINRPESCGPILTRFTNANPEYSFIGIVPRSGIVKCSSSSDLLDFNTFPGFSQAIERQTATITVSNDTSGEGHPSFVVSEPYTINGAFAGFVSVMVPHRSIPEASDRLEDLGLVELITYNADGTLLSARSDLNSAAQELPENRDLAALPINETQVFRAKNRNGVERLYSIVAVEGTPAAVLAIWRTDQAALSSKENEISPILFPLLMWFASMVVAMLAMHTLVLRHLDRIRREMDIFADTRQIADRNATGKITPLEIENLEKNFDRMSKEIVNDDARAENALREKIVLVKEIHHRVKNNLQLISSIMNMQIRAAKHDETRDVLRQVQDRVLSLATIHRDLYQSQESGRVQAGELVAEIVRKSIEIAFPDSDSLRVDTDIDPILLYPDQAVPLSLLVSEATTNAMKYCGPVDGAKPTFKLHLKQHGDACRLTIANTIGDGPPRETTGLGAKLTNAFALQLGGKVSVSEADHWYELTVEFKIEEFTPEPRDY